MTDLATPLSLRRNFSWTFAGNLVYAASQWGILVVIARLGTPEMVGQFALALAVTAPVVMFANLQLRAVQATDARRAYDFSDYLGLRLLTTAAALALIAAIALLSGYRAETALVILFVGLAKGCEALSDVIFGLLQQRERMDRIAKSLMIEGPATLVVMAAVLALTHSVAAAAAAMALVWLLQLALYDARSAARLLRARPRPRWHGPTLRRLAWLALPLGVTMLLISLRTNIPRYVMERAWGEAELGIFAALSYIMVAEVTLFNALGQATSPRMAQHFSDGNYRKFTVIVLKLIAISATVGIAGVIAAAVAGNLILSLLYGMEYAQHTTVFVALMATAAVGLIASLLNYATIATGRFGLLMPVFIGLVILTFGLSLWLIPLYGMVGAAIALAVGFVAQAIGSIVLIVRAALLSKNMTLIMSPQESV